MAELGIISASTPSNENTEERNAGLQRALDNAAGRRRVMREDGGYAELSSNGGSTTEESASESTCHAFLRWFIKLYAIGVPAATLLWLFIPPSHFRVFSQWSAAYSVFPNAFFILIFNRTLVNVDDFIRYWTSGGRVSRCMQFLVYAWAVFSLTFDAILTLTSPGWILSVSLRCYSTLLALSCWMSAILIVRLIPLFIFFYEAYIVWRSLSNERLEITTYAVFKDKVLERAATIDKLTSEFKDTINFAFATLVTFIISLIIEGFVVGDISNEYVLGAKLIFFPAVLVVCVFLIYSLNERIFYLLEIATVEDERMGAVDRFFQNNAKTVRIFNVSITNTVSSTVALSVSSALFGVAFPRWRQWIASSEAVCS